MPDREKDGAEPDSWERNSFRFPDPLKGPWIGTLFWEETGGRMECAGMSIRSDTRAAGASGAIKPTEPRQLTTSVLRSLPLASLIRNGREHLASINSDHAKGDYRLVRADDGKIAFGSSPTERARASRWEREGRRHYGDAHFQQVAEVYRSAWKAGEPPTKTVHEWGVLTYGPMSHSAAANWVARARGKGFLGRTEQRRAGGIEPEEES